MSFAVRYVGGLIGVAGLAAYCIDRATPKAKVVNLQFTMRDGITGPGIESSQHYSKSPNDLLDKLNDIEYGSYYQGKSVQLTATLTKKFWNPEENIYDWISINNTFGNKSLQSQLQLARRQIKCMQRCDSLELYDKCVKAKNKIKN